MLVSKPDRLFLQKGKDQDLYVDFKLPLPQHQIDGIRFLYRQYKKKALGVIVNDPPGYGKRMQVALFLNALRPVLRKPVLVLSNSVDNWKEHFGLWTDFGDDDIEIATSNPFIKKSVFISPVRDGLTFGRRNLGIVVVDDQDCTRELLQTSFDADYKIWITSVNLKENLRTLSLVYEWLHPKQKFNVEEFQPDITCIIDVIEKAAMLDSCVEDFLLRRSDFTTRFKKRQHKPPTPPPPPPVIATRKNKDPTGTKVKRSKRRRLEDEDLNEGLTIKDTNKEVPTAIDDKVADVTKIEEIISNEKAAATNRDVINTEATKNSLKISNDSNTSNFYNEASASKVSTATNDEVADVSKMPEINNEKALTTHRDVINTEATKSNLQMSNESNKQNFNNESTASEVDGHTENIPFNENSSESITIKVNMDESSMNLAFGEAVKELIENENKNTRKMATGDGVTPDLDAASERSEIDVKNTSKILAPETEDSNDSQNILLFNKKTLTEDNSLDLVIKAVTIPESEYTDSNCQLVKNEIVDKEEVLEIKQIIKEEENKLEETNCDTTKSIINVKGYSNGDNTNCKEKTESVKNVKDDFEAKLAELEAKALSKFKGSFLDRIF